MSLNLLKNTKFNLIINKFYKKYRNELLDILIFGSSIKGKREPKDIDLLILFKNKENFDLGYNLRKNLEKENFNIQIVIKNYSNLFDEKFIARESFLSEGYSLIHNKFISNALGYLNLFIFKYSLVGFSQSKRMQFQYALYGRDKKSGIVKEFKLIKFADTLFLSPIENSERLKEFFGLWNIKYEMFPVLIPKRIL